MVAVTGGEESAENDKPSTVTINLVPALTVMAGCKDIVMLAPVSDTTDLDKVICDKSC
jgi:histidinol dehydrogenase